MFKAIQNIDINVVHLIENYHMDLYRNKVLTELKERQQSYEDDYYVSNSKDEFFRAIARYPYVSRYEHTNMRTAVGMMRIDLTSVNRRNRRQTWGQ